MKGTLGLKGVMTHILHEAFIGGNTLRAATLKGSSSCTFPKENIKTPILQKDPEGGKGDYIIFVRSAMLRGMETERVSMKVCCWGR